MKAAMTLTHAARQGAALPYRHGMHRRTLRVLQRGQAMVEFWVAALVLIPMLLLVPMIAKYQDLTFATQMASRYASFDAMVRNEAVNNSEKPLAQLQDEVRRRFFSNPEAPIKTLDVAGDFKGHQNLFWRLPKDEAMIAKFADVTVTRKVEGASDVDAAFSNRMGGLAGIHTAEVSVKVANIPQTLLVYEPFNNLNMTITRGTSVVVDSWAVRDAATVQAKIADAKFFPAASLGTLSATLDPVLKVVEPGVTPPKLGQLSAWSGGLPADRVKAK